MEIQTAPISPEAYLAQEAQADFKSEYHAGQTVAMAGAQEPHNRIVSNILGELYACLKGKKCQVYPSDLLIKLPQCDKYVYADITVVCDKVVLENLPQKGLDVLLNPHIVIEVLSESTAVYDRTDKLKCYLKLASLKQYVLVDSTQTEVVTYTRTDTNDWLMHTETDISAQVQIGDCLIALADIYRKNVE
ncbi:Uma2 family endonuclease [Rhodoflexus caldus]|uniref:Uma2 family endonuclease n=1 Tax=Rhodoflexus caldus TaxID=2891236 RepID=UPI00202AAC6D|nr:Uma2 family endonuclease [Rhodoflexus caldus]